MTRSSLISTEENSIDGLELECDEIPQHLVFATNPNFEQGLAEEFASKIRLIPTSALVCLRMVMKFSESQAKLYNPTETQGSQRKSTPYQDILNALVGELAKSGTSIWGANFGLDQNLSTPDKNAKIEDLINEHIQKQEYEVLAINDWNLHLGSGSEILNSILKFSNKDYNFEQILEPVNASAL